MQFRSLLHCAVFLAVAANQSPAASESYGDLPGAHVVFQSVTETTMTEPSPVYGPPVVALDSIDFSPVAFGAVAQTGTSDTTSATLTTTLQAMPGRFITKLEATESGDYSLTGFGGAGTQATVTASYIVKILEVDGNAVTPLVINKSFVFSPSDGDYDLISQGPGPFVSGLWNGGAVVDLLAELSSALVSYNFGVTKAEVTLDNTLKTASEANSLSMIAKKDADLFVTTTVPEPSEIAMVGMALASLALCIRKR